METINNGETGLSVRAKINNNFSESLSKTIKTGNSIALVGDSITYNNQNDGINFPCKFNCAIGFWSWASVFTNKKYWFDSYHANFGVLGDTTTGVLARLDDVIAYNPDICIVLIGINDILSGVTASTIVSNLQSIWTQLTANGIVVIAGIIFPCSTASMSATKSKVLQQVNFKIRSIVPTLHNVYLWDSYNTLADTTSAVSGCVTALFSDGVHLNGKGAFWAGKDLAAVLNTTFPKITQSQYQSLTASDVYDATYCPNGNMVSPMLAGTSGAKIGAYATGDVATGWSVYRPIGSTIVCVASKGIVTLPNGQTYATQILTVSTPGSGAAMEQIILFQNMTTAVGDMLIAGADVTIEDLSGELLYVTPSLQIQYGAYSKIAADVYYSSGGDPIPAAFSGHMRTVTGITPAGGTTTQLNFTIALKCTSAASVKVTIAFPYARKL